MKWTKFEENGRTWWTWEQFTIDQDGDGYLWVRNPQEFPFYSTCSLRNAKHAARRCLRQMRAKEFGLTMENK